MSQTAAPLTFEVTRRTDPRPDGEREAVLADPKFGTTFTDHMVTATWREGEGWADAKVVPYGPIQLMPSAAVLHYAQEIFEGMKAYRHEDGSIWTFRPEANAQRMIRSARRMTLPALPEDDFIASLRALVEADRAWVPAGDGEKSLYLRPYMYASEAFLGVRPAREVTYSVIASPAAPTPGRTRSARRYWPTRSSAPPSPTTWSRRPGAKVRGGRAARSRHTAPSRSCPRRRCCTMPRRSSRA